MSCLGMLRHVLGQDDPLLHSEGQTGVFPPPHPCLFITFGGLTQTGLTRQKFSSRSIVFCISSSSQTQVTIAAKLAVWVFKFMLQGRNVHVPSTHACSGVAGGPGHTSTEVKVAAQLISWLRGDQASTKHVTVKKCH